MIILGLESSCDDTAAAILGDNAGILASVISGQDSIHTRFGGIVPELASRSHLQVISTVVDETLHRAGLGFENIAYIGDDLNDLPLIKKVGISACPSDAAFQVKAAATIVLTKKGGEGCLREFLENVMGYDIE